jgi:hypothetical protein
LTKTLLQQRKPVIKQGLPVEKKTLLIATFILLLLLMTMAGECFRSAQANPYASFYLFESVPPPAGAVPLTISVSSPESDAVYRVGDVTVSFNVDAQGTSIGTIYEVFFTASWLQENVTIFKQNPHSPEFPTFCSYNETFWNLPDGEYSMVITARGGGSYEDNIPVGHFWGTVYGFDMTSISVVNFTVATLPEISILSLKNTTYDSSDVPLSFTVNKAVTQISYVLDGQVNRTITGNATLTDLSNGYHNVTVYATDEAGNVGVSETVYFNVNVPFPVVTVAAGSTVVIAAVGAGLLLYSKKRRQEAEQA